MADDQKQSPTPEAQIEAARMLCEATEKLVNAQVEVDPRVIRIRREAEQAISQLHQAGQALEERYKTFRDNLSSQINSLKQGKAELEKGLTEAESDLARHQEEERTRRRLELEKERTEHEEALRKENKMRGRIKRTAIWGAVVIGSLFATSLLQDYTSRVEREHDGLVYQIITEKLTRQLVKARKEAQTEREKYQAEVNGQRKYFTTEVNKLREDSTQTISRLQTKLEETETCATEAYSLGTSASADSTFALSQDQEREKQISSLRAQSEKIEKENSALLKKLDAMIEEVKTTRDTVVTMRELIKSKPNSQVTFTSYKPLTIRIDYDDDKQSFLEMPKIENPVQYHLRK